MRRFSRILVPLACLACLGSCRFPEDPALSARTIVIWEQEDAAVAPFMDSVFEAFRALPGNADVKVVRTHYNTEDLRQQFLTASIAGSPPDLVMGPSDSAGVYSVAGFILPVDGTFGLERYNKPVIEAVTLDGRVWGVPTSNGNHLMLFYNKRLSPEPPRTTDELLRFCATTAKKLKLRHCMAFNLAEPFWLMPWLGAYGGWPIDNKTPTLDTQAMRDAVAFVVDLIHGKKYAPMECDYNCMDALFKEEEVAFVINGDWAISSYQERFKADLGAAKIPRHSGTGLWPTPMVSGKYFMLSSKLEAEKLELVKSLVEFYTNRENQIAQVRELMRLPSLAEAARAGEITGDPVLRASMDQILAGKPMPMATEMRAVWDAIRPPLGKAIILELTPEEAARKMQRDAAAKIEEMRD
ncbi:MAG: extracellular solute-binding protein [Elusimicrobiota bacterium]